MTKAVLDAFGRNGRRPRYLEGAERVRRAQFDKHQEIDLGGYFAVVVQLEVDFRFPVALRAQIVADVVSLVGDKGVSCQTGRWKFLSRTNTEFADQCLLPRSERKGLVARHENSSHAIERAKLDAQLDAVAFTSNSHVREIADDLQNAFDPGDRADGHPHPVSVAGGDQGCSWTRDSVNQGLHASWRIDTAVDHDAADRRCGLGGCRIGALAARRAAIRQDHDSRGEGGKDGCPERVGNPDFQSVAGHGNGLRIGYSKVSSRRRLLVWMGIPCCKE